MTVSVDTPSAPQRPYQPGHFARLWPDKAAVIVSGTDKTDDRAGPDDVVVTYLELEQRSCQLAALLRARGLRVGDHLAVLMENHPRSLEIAFAAMRLGLYFTPINWHLTPNEVEHILFDSEAKCLITTPRLAPIARQAMQSGRRLEHLEVRLVLGESEGFETYDDAIAGYSRAPLEHEVQGAAMFYSSGTTGRPKGIVRAAPSAPFGISRPWPHLVDRYSMDSSTVYLSPGPLYHAAPGGWTMMINQLGATNVITRSFDATSTLELIERYRVTHAQMVPTMFVRLLKLSEQTRAAHDLSSLRYVIHSAAPCPVDVKHKMIDWLGPRVYEYYGSSEGGGFAAITPDEWAEHPGSVGRPAPPIHVLDEETGVELGPGEVGVLYSEGGNFRYYNDPESTSRAFNDRGWVTVGDLGYLAEDGYLYLSDRRDDMIVAGGVNIYTREVEDALITHPAVLDVGVIGIAHEEFGQEVKAVVQLVDGFEPGNALAETLIAWCSERIARFKCPRSIDFVDELPRLPNGKLLKRQLRQRYDSLPT